MAEVIREVTVDGATYRVSNIRGILDPGRFEGEMPHAVRDYMEIPDQQIELYPGTGGASVFQVGHRYYSNDDQGFVTEINYEEYQAIVDEANADYDETLQTDPLLASL